EIAARRARAGEARFSPAAAEASGEIVVRCEGVSFAWPGAPAPVVRDFDALVLRGEKIGVIGPNGAGKTTLLRLLLGSLAPQRGKIAAGSRVSPVFLDQLRDELRPDATVAEAVADGRDRVAVDGTTRHVLGYLQDFLFSPDRARTPVSALSGGEKARLLLARLFLKPGNLLVLDEPTNDLDVETLEILEDRLVAYPGTILLASHDRDFLDHVATSSFVLLGNGRVHVCPGGYADWEREKPAVLARLAEEDRRCGGAAAASPEAAAGARAQPQKAPVPPAAGDPDPPAPKRPARLGFNEKRELAALPAKIEALESEISALEATLSDGTAYARDPVRAAADAARLPAARSDLETVLERWMALEELAAK
ncbi:MAG: ATP-binding cassette domain-containing protein, partial [Kiritimatiellae bacterium]|nr:ATP-binding cassette domain-containing protein [Kiritimatiellia bacterium]